MDRGLGSSEHVALDALRSRPDCVHSQLGGDSFLTATGTGARPGATEYAVGIPSLSRFFHDLASALWHIDDQQDSTILNVTARAGIAPYEKDGTA